MLNYPLNYKIIGKGQKTVLFLHGYGGSIDSFLPVAQTLAKTHKLILVDMYGFGKTAYPNRVMDTYDYALSIYLLLQQLNINEVSIVSHSFGGRLALVLSSMFNLNISKMVLVGCAGLKPHRGISYYYKVLKYKLYKKFEKFKLVKPKTLNKFGSEEYRKLNALQKRSYVKIVNQNLFYLLKYIKTNTLLVWGTNDKSTPIYMAKTLKKHIKNSGIVLYQNSSHFCYLENFVNFCAVLHSFL